MNLRFAAAIAILAVALFGFSGKGGEPSPSPVSPVPAGIYRDAISQAEAVAKTMSSRDKQILAGLYTAAAKAVAADGNLPQPAIGTTAKLREFHVAVLNFVWRGYGDNLPGKYPQLAPAVESAMKRALGDDVKALDREAAIRTLEALAWAFR